MTDRFFVIADRRHLRIFREDLAPQQSTPTMTTVQAVDIVDGRGNYWDRDTDQAGRFPYSKGRTGGPQRTAAVAGMSIDERLPMQEEHDRRIVTEIASHLNAFLQQHPQAHWNFAAGPALQQALLEKVDPAAKQRLEQTIQKELANVPPPELRAYFNSSSRPLA